MGLVENLTQVRNKLEDNRVSLETYCNDNGIEVGENADLGTLVAAIEAGGGGSGGLIASGSFTPTVSTAFQRITHNLGVIPNFAIVMVDQTDASNDIGLRSAVAIGLKDPAYPTVALCSTMAGTNFTTGGQIPAEFTSCLQLLRFDQTKWAADQLGEYILPGNTIFREATTTQLVFGIFQEAGANVISSNIGF